MSTALEPKHSDSQSTTSAASASVPSGAILSLGFGTTVAMWAVAYVCRLPGVMAPGPLLAALFVACLAAGGFLSGRWLGGGARPAALVGAQVGALAGLLNLLILGSVFRDVLGGNAAQAVFWVPGTIAAGALLGTVGALLSRERAAPGQRPWSSAFGRVAACATLLLLSAGGLVTGHDAGLAVPDWPNSFETNMFLYPLSRMTGGIYYEHAHRLFGSLVGLTTLVLAAHLVRNDRRRWLKGLAIAAFVAVCVQGLLGGLRVTGRLTLSADAADLSPSTALAVVHGVTGQLFFCLLCALAAFVAKTWQEAAPPAELEEAERERRAGTISLATGLAALLVFQLFLGALLRHLHTTSTWHITGAVFVLLLSVAVGVRGMSLHKDQPVLPRLGLALCGLVAFQFLLGWVALAATLMKAGALADWQAAITTLHQTTGALLLASAVLFRLWAGRLLGPAGPQASGAAPQASGAAAAG